MGEGNKVGHVDTVSALLYAPITMARPGGVRSEDEHAALMNMNMSMQLLLAAARNE